MSKEVDVKELPSELASILKKKIIDTKTSSIPLKSIPEGAADFYTYRISIHDGANRKIIECNQYNIQQDLKSLIKYIEKYSNEK